MLPNVHCSSVHDSQDVEAPKWPSTDEWIKKMWCIYTIEYYSVIQKNETMSTAETRIDLEIIMLNNNKSGREGQISCDIP